MCGNTTPTSSTTKFVTSRRYNPFRLPSAAPDNDETVQASDAQRSEFDDDEVEDEGDSAEMFVGLLTSDDPPFWTLLSRVRLMYSEKPSPTPCLGRCSHANVSGLFLYPPTNYYPLVHRLVLGYVPSFIAFSVVIELYRSPTVPTWCYVPTDFQST